MNNTVNRQLRFSCIRFGIAHCFLFPAKPFFSFKGFAFALLPVLMKYQISVVSLSENKRRPRLAAKLLMRIRIISLLNNRLVKPDTARWQIMLVCVFQFINYFERWPRLGHSPT